MACSCNAISATESSPGTVIGVVRSSVRRPYAATLKFLSVLPLANHRKFKFKAALKSDVTGAPLIPKFASEVAAISCELRNRSSTQEAQARAESALARLSARRHQFEAVNSGLPSAPLMSACHIFWIDATTLSGIGT